MVGWLVGWLVVGGLVKPSQPQRIISGLNETFIKRYIANQADIRLKEQIEKENCLGNLSCRTAQPIVLDITHITKVHPVVIYLYIMYCRKT